MNSRQGATQSSINSSQLNQIQNSLIQQPIRFGSFQDQTQSVTTAPTTHDIQQGNNQQPPTVYDQQQRYLTPNQNDMGVGYHENEVTQQNQHIHQQYNLMKSVREFQIPIDNEIVKYYLRFLCRPITLFAQSQPDRRHRLSKQIQFYALQHKTLPQFPEVANFSNQAAAALIKKRETFYTHGAQQLKQCRVDIAEYSLPRSMERIAQEKKIRQQEDRFKSAREYAQYIKKNIVSDNDDQQSYSLKVSQYADQRCVARGALSNSDRFFVTAGWSGKAKLWSIPDCELHSELIGHNDKVISACFHPQAEISLSEYGPNIATASIDGTVRLWSMIKDDDTQKSFILKSDQQQQASSEYASHKQRCNFVRFHPMGRHLASSSHDKTWKLWDLQTQKLLLTQTGHIAPVYGIDFQKDGSLLASGDLNGIALAWDLRSGREILFLKGHVKQILAVTFLQNSYQLATASDDNTVKIWDLRKRGCIYTIPAHMRPVSDVKFSTQQINQHSTFMATSGYDGKIKLWGTMQWDCIDVINAHQNKATSVSIARDGQFMVSTSFDKSFHFWVKNDIRD